MEGTTQARRNTKRRNLSEEIVRTIRESEERNARTKKEQFFQLALFLQ
jgi:hypothetical protein